MITLARCGDLRWIKFVLKNKHAFGQSFPLPGGVAYRPVSVLQMASVKELLSPRERQSLQGASRHRGMPALQEVSLTKGQSSDFGPPS
jgi:hypothetical protein